MIYFERVYSFTPIKQRLKKELPYSTVVVYFDNEINNNISLSDLIDVYQKYYTQYILAEKILLLELGEEELESTLLEIDEEITIDYLSISEINFIDNNITIISMDGEEVFFTSEYLVDLVLYYKFTENQINLIEEFLYDRDKKVYNKLMRKKEYFIENIRDNLQIE